MALNNAALSPVLRILLSQDVPASVRHVVMTVPQTAPGKLMFNVVRHVLSLIDYVSAAAIDLQRLQMSSQLLGVVHVSSFLFRVRNKEVSSFLLEALSLLYFIIG